MKVQVLVDNKGSWIIPYAEQLVGRLTALGHQVRFIINHAEIEQGDILVLLGCEKILKATDFNKHNLVIHESYLPKGKGWSPLSWQILEGKDEIPVTLFEAVKNVDAGHIYYQEIIKLKGDELIDEIRDLQGRMSILLVLKFFENYPNNNSVEQSGESTFYERRTPSDSELNLDKTIREQFNLMRVVDNERYPAYFKYKGRKFIIKIYGQDKNFE